jgi:hypothetical protein
MLGMQLIHQTRSYCTLSNISTRVRREHSVSEAKATSNALVYENWLYRAHMGSGRCTSIYWLSRFGPSDLNGRRFAQRLAEQRDKREFLCGSKNQG